MELPYGTLETQIPFQGFYESLYSSAIDSEEEQWAEYEESHRQTENGIPKELQLDAGTLMEIRMRHTDYRKSQRAICGAYVWGFNAYMRDALGWGLGLGYGEMTSPREYNFETDRIFCTIPMESVLRMFWISEQEGHKALAKVLEDRHTSYSGFRSFYSNDLDTWLEKPVLDWDSQELQSLLIAVGRINGAFEEGKRRRDWEMDVYEEACSDSFINEIDEGVDWSAIEAEIETKRLELAAELSRDKPNYVEPVWRCPRTPDMFQTQ